MKFSLQGMKVSLQMLISRNTNTSLVPVWQVTHGILTLILSETTLIGT